MRRDSVILCAVLWAQKKEEHSKMEELCQVSASIALDDF